MIATLGSHSQAGRVDTGPGKRPGAKDGRPGTRASCRWEIGSRPGSLGEQGSLGTHTIAGAAMSRERLNFLFLNVGHFLDHLFMLIFATVAALRLAEEWGMSYAALIPYATPGFVAFGICAIPAGWLADKWSREGHDDHLLHRHRGELDRDGAGGLPAPDCGRTVRDRRVRGDLPPRRPRDGRARADEDRHSARDQRRVRQPRRCRRRAAHRVVHRHRGLAQCVRPPRRGLHRPRRRLRGVRVDGTGGPGRRPRAGRRGRRRPGRRRCRSSARPSCGCSRSSCSPPRSAA